MAQRTQAPKFGEWEENAQYTTYFDNERKPKGTRKSTSNDHQYEQEQIGPSTNHDSTNRTAAVNSPLHHHRHQHSHRHDQHDGYGLNQETDPPLGHENITGPEPPVQPRRNKQSPLHPKKARVSSPSWEIKGSPQSQGHGHGLAPLTPGRSRLRSVTRGSESTDHSASVPAFGEWDESNPASAENFTQLFKLVRDEKQNDDGSLPAGSRDQSYSNGHVVNDSHQSSKKSCCCFPWGKI